MKHFHMPHCHKPTWQEFIHLPKAVCTALLGPNHPKAYRMVVGVLVMALGVFIAHTCAEVHDMIVHYFWGVLDVTPAVHYVGDGFGYALHGMGLVPFCEALIETA